MTEGRIKVNPRWEKADMEEVLLWSAHVPLEERVVRVPYPRRCNTPEEFQAGQWIPPLLVEQPDGTWVESF